jgi:hypothetical protein
MDLRPAETELFRDVPDRPTCTGQLFDLVQDSVLQKVEGPLVATINDVELGLERQGIITVDAASFGEVDLEPRSILGVIVLWMLELNNGVEHILPLGGASGVAGRRDE